MTTILTACPSGNRRPLLTKTFRLGDHGEITKTPYDRAYLFDAHRLDLVSIHDLHEALTWLEDQPHSCLIRGEPIDATISIRRALNNCPDRGQATIRIVEDGLHWVMLDFDHLPVASRGLDKSVSRLDYLVNLLPDAFRRASYHYQWSSSAGLDGWTSLSCHLWFWLDQPWRCRDLFERFHNGDFASCEVDPAPFTANQVHYTARPLFVGMSDPIEHRSGFIAGDHDTVELPVWRRPIAPPSEPSRYTGSASYGHNRFKAMLAEIGPNYHRPILSAVAYYFAVTPRAEIDEQWLEERVREAIHNGVPGKNRKTDYLDNQYLRRVIQGARKFGGSN